MRTPLRDTRPRVPFAAPLGYRTGMPMYRPRRPMLWRTRAVFRLQRRAARWWWTHRRTLAPVTIALTLYAAASALHSAPGGARTSVSLSLLIALYAAWRIHGCPPRFASGRTSWARRFVRTGSKNADHIRYGWAATAAAITWLITAAHIGPQPPMPGLLIIGTLIAGTPWWWHHRIRNAPPPEAWSRTWDEYVGGEGGRLPGSRLIDYEQIKGGWSATVLLPPGKLTTSTAIAATEGVASAYGRPVSSVVVEPTSDSNAARARLMVLVDNPLQRVVPWPGPDLLDVTSGVAPVGMYPDGVRAMYRFYRERSGPVHDLISGTMGSGKSVFTSVLLAYERHSDGLMCSWVGDPQSGQSLPDWIDHVDFSVRDADGCYQMLLMARAVMYARSTYLANMDWVDEKGRQRHGKGFFEPTREMPLLVVTIDEAHRVLENPQAVKVAEEIANMSRKCGIKLRFITQVPLLAQLGGSTALRDALAGGNVIVFRTANRVGAQAVLNGALPVEPAKLPRQYPDGSTTSGLGYILGASDRPATMRAFYDEDPIDWAMSGRTTPLDEMSARAAEKVAHELGVAYRSAPPVRDAAAAVTIPQQSRADGGTAKDAIVAYLEERGRQATTAVISDALELPKSTVSSSLTRLESEGMVRKVRHGMWESARVLEPAG